MLFKLPPPRFCSHSHPTSHPLGVFVLEAASGDGCCFHSEISLPEVALARVDRCGAYRPAALAGGHGGSVITSPWRPGGLMISSQTLALRFVLHVAGAARDAVSCKQIGWNLGKLKKAIYD